MTRKEKKELKARRKEEEARIIATFPKKYVTKKGKIRIPKDSELDRLTEEDPDLFERMYPFIMDRLTEKTVPMVYTAIVVSAISILLSLIRLLLLK